MPTDSGNEDSDESAQYALRQEEKIGENSVDNHDPVEVHRPMRILGAPLRFVGMAIIIGSAFLIFLSDDKSPLLLVSCLVGAGLHFVGRKLAPDAHWASATGGAVAGVGSIALIALIGAFIFGFLFILVHPGEWWGWLVELFELLGY